MLLSYCLFCTCSRGTGLGGSSNAGVLRTVCHGCEQPVEWLLSAHARPDAGRSQFTNIYVAAISLQSHSILILE